MEEDDTFAGLPPLPQHTTHQLLNEFVHGVSVQFDAPTKPTDIMNSQGKREEAYRKF